MIKVRVATPADAAALVAIYTPYVEETTITFDYEVPSEATFVQNIEETVDTYPYFVAEDEGEILGYAYAHPYKNRAAYDWAVEVSVYVDRTKRGNGTGKVLYQALEAALKKQNVAILTACITGGNQSSIHFHTKLGYQEVASFPKIGYKFDQWLDVIWLQKFLTKPEGQLPAFIPFAKLDKKVTEK
ncbi:GNAT family N-acetyltransferase [Enterococcus xiangfangensis]|uniref:GNAT family N-acetyltransferase n=1 Tax=Enterococcus xiangfangensis TaxID=1296537 RepID=UPI0010F91E78|nr:GNAT family N-acetyltransferase [Enterococcus xiangfangensis]MBM7710891.1 phosphinothricin acetyltransferase [Enterococcus xiangfangensis]NBK07908.1 N-acetyltransferase family protein [Enterococcus asini]